MYFYLEGSDDELFSLSFIYDNASKRVTDASKQREEEP